MNKKILGGLLVAAAFISCFLWGLSNVRPVDQDSAAETNNANRYEETIDTLTEEKQQLREQNAGFTNDNTAVVVDQAEQFLKAYYNNDSANVSSQRERIKPLMTEKLYNSIFGEVSDTPDGGGVAFKTYLDEIQSFSSTADADTATVLILCTLNSMTDGVDMLSQTPLLFHAAFVYSDGTWLVSEIFQNRTFRYN